MIIFSVREFKTKWRHIKDNFMKMIRHNKNVENGNLTKKKQKIKKPYIYSEKLQFLMTNEIKAKPRKNLRVKNTEMEENNDSVLRPHKMLKTSKVTQCSSQSYDFPLEVTVSPTAPSATEDYDRLFLLSMLSDYKSLDEDEKLEFKFMTLEFFRNSRQTKRLQLAIS